MRSGPMTSLIQVTNIAPVVTNEQLRTLFTNVGPIREFICYPTNDTSQQISRVCYVRFADPMNVCVAQHLTNTVFIDRAIMVKPVHDNRIPDEATALKLANEGHSQNSSNNGVISQIETVNGVQSIATIDPRLDALGLPHYPPLSPSLDPAKIEEIRRTIVVSNVNKQTTPEQLLEFFNQFGEVKYLRMTTDENDVIKSAMIEYTDQSSVANALQNTGISLHGSQLTLAHSTTSILKPQYKINVDPNKFPETRELMPKLKRSRSRSVSRRSRSPSHSRKSSRRSRTPSRHRRSRDRRRSTSRSRSPSRRSSRRSRSRERIEHSPYSSRRRSSRDRSYSRERIRSSRRDRSKERDRYRSSRDRSIEVRRNYERERDRRDRERERSERDRKRHSDRGRDDREYVERHDRIHGRIIEREERPRKRSRSRESERSRLSEKRDRRKDGPMYSGLIEHIDRHNRSRSRSGSRDRIKIIKSPLITGNIREEDEMIMLSDNKHEKEKLMDRDVSDDDRMNLECDDDHDDNHSDNISRSSSLNNDNDDNGQQQRRIKGEDDDNLADMDMEDDDDDDRVENSNRYIDDDVGDNDNDDIDDMNSPMIKKIERRDKRHHHHHHHRRGVSPVPVPPPPPSSSSQLAYGSSSRHRTSSSSTVHHISSSSSSSRHYKKIGNRYDDSDDDKY